MAAELAIQSITNANLVWARSNLGPLDDLADDIKKNGVHTPLLIQPDFLMIDGARRLTVAQQVGLKYVPVIICHTWTDVVANLRPTEKDCLPMDWPDLHQFWVLTLKTIASKQQHIDAARTRKQSSRISKHLKNDGYSGFILDLSKIYGIPPATVKLFRDYYVKLVQMRDEYPLFVNGVLNAFPTGEEARDLLRTRFIKALVERVKRAEITEQEALTLFHLRMRRSGTAADNMIHHTRRARPKAYFSTNAKPITMVQVANLIGLLEDVAHTSQEFRVFEDGDPESERRTLIERITYATRDISNMRRRLEAVGKPPKEQDV